MSRSFLDSASGQPLNPAAREAQQGFADRVWADSSQPYHEGRASAQILNAARETVASVVGVDPSRISFHPASICAALAIRGTYFAMQSGMSLLPGHVKSGDPQLLASRVERAEVLAQVSGLNAGHERLVNVDRMGRVDLTDLRDAINAAPGRSSLLALQTANLELGTRQPLAGAAGIANIADRSGTSAVGTDRSVTLVTDATGSLGLVDIDPVWSVMFADATGWAGPTGVAILAIRDPLSWRMPPELSWVSTTNPAGYPADSVGVLSAVEAAAALHAVYTTRFTESARLANFIDRIRGAVPSLISDVDILGDPTNRLPNIVTFSVLYADGERLASELDRLGVAVGSGSACASRVGLPSHVLAAIGALTHGNVRVSLSIGVDEAAIEHFLRVLPTAVDIVRSEASAP